jgi:hypothetical protein
VPALQKINFFIRVNLLRAFLRYTLQAALTRIQNVPDILVRKNNSHKKGRTPDIPGRGLFQ